MYSRYYMARKGAASGGGAPPGANFKDTVLAKSPSGFWRLGEPSGTTAVDETGTQNGTYVDSPTLAVAGITTDGDTGITNVAAPDGVSVADNNAWDFGTNDFTLMWAMKRTGTWPASAEFLFGHNGDGGTGSWALNLQGGNEGRLDLRFESTAYVLRTTNPATTHLSNNAWHLCFVTADRSGLAELWVDGVSQWTVDISPSAATNLVNTNVLYLGRRNAGTSFLGSYDEMAVWNNTLLLAADIAQLQGVL